jgi:hypothetical protein
MRSGATSSAERAKKAWGSAGGSLEGAVASGRGLGREEENKKMRAVIIEPRLIKQ